MWLSKLLASKLLNPRSSTLTTAFVRVSVSIQQGWEKPHNPYTHALTTPRDTPIRPVLTFGSFSSDQSLMSLNLAQTFPGLSHSKIQYQHYALS